MMRVSDLDGWGVMPLPYRPTGLTPTWREIAGRRVPHRFGGLWREMAEVDGTLSPTGREVELWLVVNDGRAAVERVTFVGFADDFDRQGLPAMRDKLTELVALLDGQALEAFSAGTFAEIPTSEQVRLGREIGRRRRSNAVDLERVASLYRSGGAKLVAAEYDIVPVSEATAYRWIRSARDAGILEERGQ
jgi:hypothetical protein